MSKARLAVIICFALAFAAGGAVGWLWGPEAKGRRRSSLMHELNLTKEQQEKMRKIWSDAQTAGRQRERELREQRDALDKEREQRIRALLTAEQLPQYDEILRDHDTKTAALSGTRRRAFQDVVEQTKLILTEPQRKKYEEILKKQAEAHRRRVAAREAEGSAAPPPSAPQRGE